jgi:SAM-dependent methyltransferase
MQISNDQLPATGERLVPYRVAGDNALEHLHRYAMAVLMARGRDVLDIACGEGYGSALLAAVARRVVGVDIVPDVVDHARRKYRQENLSFEVGSCTALPLPEASLDLVVSFETLEHVAEHDTFLAEVKRALRPGGRLIISTPDKQTYADGPQHRNPYHVKELYRPEFEALLQRHFRHVVLLGQRVCHGSLVVPLKGAAALGEFLTIRGHYQGLEAEAGLAGAVFLVAVAGDTPEAVRDAHPGFFEGKKVPSSLELVAQMQQQQLAELARRRDEAERHLAEVVRQLEAVRRSLTPPAK